MQSRFIKVAVSLIARFTQRRPAPLERDQFVAPPNVDWEETSTVVVNSKILVHVPGGMPDTQEYLIVECGQEDGTRNWVSEVSWRLIEKCLGKEVGHVVTLANAKGTHRFEIHAVHVPTDGRRFRLSELMEQS